MILELINKIKDYNTIIIHRHKRPDMDAIGSQVGLAESIKSTFPNKKVFIVGDMQEKVSFFETMDEIEDEEYKDALAIICDVAVSHLISDERYVLAKEIFVIDHHTNETDIKDAKAIIDSSYIAAAELVAQILISNDFIISSRTATALYAGIVADSDRFKYNNTSARTFSIASKLVELGADIQYVYKNLYVESLKTTRLKNYFANKFQVTPEGIAYLINKEDVFEKFDVDFFTISRGMVSVMSGIEEVKIWCNFTVDTINNVIGCELRSREISIVDTAKKYGGGGHNLACGTSVQSWDVVNDILEDLKLKLL